MVGRYDSVMPLFGYSYSFLYLLTQPRTPAMQPSDQPRQSDVKANRWYYQPLSYGSPALAARWLLSIMLILVLMSTAGQYLRHVIGFNDLRNVIDKFYLDSEESLPTYFSGVLLLLIAGLLGLISLQKRRTDDRFAPHWRWLAWLFVLLSVDEQVGFHELLMRPMKALANFTGALTFSWVIPAALLTAVVGVAYSRFLWHLPRSIRSKFLASAVLYVAGCIGLEMIGANHYWLYGKKNFGYALLISIEEALEMSGLILFIYTLLTYLRDRLALDVVFSSPTGRPR